MKRNLTNMFDEDIPNSLKVFRNFKYGITVSKNKQKKKLIINAQSISLLGTKLETYLTNILAGELEKMFKFSKAKKILVVGLGNSEIYNDSLGPIVAKKLVVSRGLNLKPEVSVFAPDVYSNTGIQTCEIIKSICKIVKPNLVVLVDSFSTVSINRLCTCFQVFEGGISAGSGANFKNKTISKEYLEVERVVSIGVPMLIYGQDLVSKCEGLNIKNSLNSSKLILSPANIKQNINLVSNIISMAINKTLFKKLSDEEIKTLIE